MYLLSHQRRYTTTGFTLLEVMVATTLLFLLIAVIAGVMNQTSQTIRTASSQIDLFQSARQGFDTLTRNLSLATLNTYWDYDSSTAPTTYIRQSDLQFLINKQSSSFGVFFQAPRAYASGTSYNQTTGLLNAMGYYVKYGDDSAFRPAHITTPRWRYRLMQALQSTELLEVFSDKTNAWATNLKTKEWPVADNVIAMILWPRLSVRDDASGNKLTKDYTYDSRGTLPIQQAQLPPVVQVTMVAISESSAARLSAGSAPPVLITGALQDKFQDVSHYSEDLVALKNALQAAHIEYKEFTTTVSIRESKWSGIP